MIDSQNKTSRYLMFVYGSLKRGFAAHGILQDSQCETLFIKDSYTHYANYDMISLETFPAVLKNGKFKISGEVYQVNRYGLNIIDDLESNGSLYKREQVKIHGINEYAWMYIFLKENLVPMDYNRNENIAVDGNIKTWMNPW